MGELYTAGQVRSKVEIVFVRHGEPEWLNNGRAVDKPALTELGRQQAQCAAQALRGQHFDGFYVSTLLRAQQTAQPIAEVLQQKPVDCPWFVEHQAKYMQGASAKEVAVYFAKWNKLSLGEKAVGPAGGECFDSLLKRVSAGIDAVMAKHGFTFEVESGWRVWHLPQEPVRLLFVGHNIASNVAMHHLLGVEHSPWEGERFHMGWGAFCRLVPWAMSSGYIWRLKGVDERAHLASLSYEDP